VAINNGTGHTTLNEHKQNKKHNTKKSLKDEKHGLYHRGLKVHVNVSWYDYL